MNQPELYEFGGLRLDVSNARLTRGLEVLALPPKTFDVLVALVRHRGQLVDKDALLREVWPDTFVEEANLSRHIWTLRRAMGADALVETVPKRGYRIAADVREVPLGDVVIERRIETRTFTSQETIVRSSSRRWLWSAALAGVLGLAWLAWGKAAGPAALSAADWFSRAETARIEGRFRHAVPLYKRALELDPNYAIAESRLSDTYAALREPAERHAHALRAHALRAGASERERLLVDATYYSAIGDRPREADALRLLIEANPADVAPRKALAAVYRETGRYEPALAQAQEAARLDPSAEARALLARALIDLDRLDEARNLLEADRDSPSAALHELRFELALMRGDRAAMQTEVEWAVRSDNEDAAAQWQAQAYDFLGRRRDARALFARSLVLLETQGSAQRVAEVAAVNASRDAIVGHCGSIDASIAEALAARTFNTLTLTSLSHALCGDMPAARMLLNELARTPGLDWLNRTVSVPIIRAFLGVSDGAEAVDLNALARTIEPYELGQTLWPIYLRGIVHMKTGRLDEASDAFRRILAHRGAAGMSVRYPLARVQLARVLSRQGHVAASRDAYEEFLRGWSEADADLPILIDARAEAEQVRHSAFGIRH